MTPYDFLRKWRNVELKERTASQSHFNDLCALLGILDPIGADPTGEWFTFEKGATKTGGGEGWADVWRRGCFAWEYKGRHANLDKAYQQLQQYAVALENPPLLITSDMDRIRIHTNWTNTVQEVHDFTLEDLIDGDTRERLKRAFTDPDFFKPSKTRAALTEETAREFAGLAQRLRDRGHEAHEVAHFVNRLAFCMFAEDVGLLPNDMFTKMLDVSRHRPDDFADNAADLFRAMAFKGGKIGFDRIEWFNGGLFEDDRVLPVTDKDIEELLDAAKRDWSAIDPSILGTLFERGLDPGKRSQLGAHYTDRAKIMQIVEPVIQRPLEAEWATVFGQAKAAVEAADAKADAALAAARDRGELADEVRDLENALKSGRQLALFEGLARQKRVRGLDAVRAELRDASRNVAAARDEVKAVRDAFVDRLRAFRVLDPACGSGNFLYVALLTLKDLEHRVNIEAETLGVPRIAPSLGPENVLGIELNPYAAELARVSVWIGDIQWMRRNGFEAARNPILRPLDTIECRDAVLNDDGTRAEWPVADVVVGNPPFLGSSKMISELGEDYSISLRKAWLEVPGSADLVCYWFAKAWAMTIAGKLQRVGLVSTNSIRGGANRELLKPVVEHGRIFDAWSDEGWTVDGAAVRVSLICFDATKGSATLNGKTVGEIASDLTAHAFDLTKASQLRENANICFEGFRKYGELDISGDTARDWLRRPLNVNGRPNVDVLFPYVGGRDIAGRNEDVWVIDFYGRSEDQAALYEAPFAHALLFVQPYRSTVRDAQRRQNWWLFGRSGTNLRRAIAPLDRLIVTPRVAKHRLFVWEEKSVRPSDATNAIARDDDTSFGILHSRFHETWSLRTGTFLGVGNDPRYTPSTTFETFPFPEDLTPDIPAADYADDPRAQAIAAAAARLNELRENWLNPADLVVREPEVVPGYPDRILPKDEDAAKELKQRTLTNLYNARPHWLANAHAALDQAVADAYGWGDDWRAGLAAGHEHGLTDDDILARLFVLNQARA